MGVAVHDRGVAHKEKVAPSRVGKFCQLTSLDKA